MNARTYALRAGPLYEYAAAIAPSERGDYAATVTRLTRWDSGVEPRAIYGLGRFVAEGATEAEAVRNIEVRMQAWARGLEPQA
jgi:hypothetical protein